MTDTQHVALAEALKNVRGKVAISGYASSLYEDLYVGWTRLEAPPRTIHSTKDERVEVLWVNYEPEAKSKEELWKPEASLFAQ